MASNASLSNKHKRKDLREQKEQEEQEEMIEALCAKRNSKHRATNTPFESINADIHLDLRQVKWSLMVGPALRPKNLFGQQIQQLQINDPVVHAVAIRSGLEADPDGSLHEVLTRYTNVSAVWVTWEIHKTSCILVLKNRCNCGEQVFCRQWQRMMNQDFMRPWLI